MVKKAINTCGLDGAVLTTGSFQLNKIHETDLSFLRGEKEAVQAQTYAATLIEFTSSVAAHC